MISPANLFRMMIEMIFVLLGGFLAFLGLSNRFLFNPRSPAWLGLGAVLVYWERARGQRPHAPREPPTA